MKSWLIVLPCVLRWNILLSLAVTPQVFLATSGADLVRIHGKKHIGVPFCSEPTPNQNREGFPKKNDEVPPTKQSLMCSFGFPLKTNKRYKRKSHAHRWTWEAPSPKPHRAAPRLHRFYSGKQKEAYPFWGGKPKKETPQNLNGASNSLPFLIGKPFEEPDGAGPGRCLAGRVLCWSKQSCT